MKKLLSIVLVLVLMTTLFAGCAKKSDNLVGGVAMPTKSLQRWNQDGANIKAKLEDAGYKVVLEYAEDKVETQVSQIENMITKGVKVLVVASIDGTALKGVLQEAADEGIQVIAYDRLIKDSANVDYYATFDNYKVGQIQGDFIVEAMDLANGTGPFNMEVFGGSPDDNNAFVFNAGAMDTLQPFIDNGQLVINSGQVDMDDIAIPGWKPEGAQARMDNLLTANYADIKIDVVLSPNDSLAQGIVASLKAAGYGTADLPFPVLTGQDCDTTNVKMIIAGEQSMSIFKDTRTLADNTVKMVDAIMKEEAVPVNDTESYDNGVKVVPSFLAEPVFADINNYEKLLIDSGYYTADQLGGLEAVEAKESKSDAKVGVAMPTKSLQRWNQDGANMKAKLEDAGYEVVLEYAEDKVETQVSQIENMITKGVKVLVVASIDGTALKGVLKEAGEEGIQVIAYDRLIKESGDVSYYATFDNYKVGQIQGEFIVEAMDLANGAGPFNMEVFGGSPDDNNAFVFNAGAMDTLQPYIDNGQLLINSGQVDMEEIAIPGWKPEGAQARMDNLLTANYADKMVDVVLSPNDSLAQGIVASLKAAGYGTAEVPFPVLTGQDCDTTNVKMIIAGEQSMSIFKDTRTLADNTVAMVDAIMRGETVPVNDTESYDNGVLVVPSFLAEPVFADINNYKELLVDSGYYTADQLK